VEAAGVEQCWRVYGWRSQSPPAEKAKTTNRNGQLAVSSPRKKFAL
jgi:hypothetical protein